MPDKIFTVLGKWMYDIDEKIKRVNDFLEKNENYEIKSVTKIIKPEGKVESFTGVIIVAGEKNRESK